MSTGISGLYKNTKGAKGFQKITLEEMTIEQKMNIGTACAIFKQLDSDKYTYQEKERAIYIVINMETHNGITKCDLLKALKYMWNEIY